MCTRTVCLHTGPWTGQGRRSCTEGMCVPAPPRFLCFRSWSSVGVPGRWAAHTQSCEASLQTHVYSHTCAQAQWLWLPCPASRGRRGASRIFPLLSAAMELPVLLERLPNMLIGTPAMIKKKFQIRATTPQSSGRKQLFRNPAGAGFQGCFPLLILKVTASNCCFAHDQSSTNSHQAGPKP